MIEFRLSLIVLTAPFVVLFALAVLRADFLLYQQVRDHGRPATAVIQRIEPAFYTGRPEGGRKVTYTLDLPGPAVINGSAHMTKTTAERYSPGQEIEIVYAAHNPNLNALSVAHAWNALVSNVIIFVAYGAVFALVLALLRTAPRKSWRAPPRTWAR